MPAPTTSPPSERAVGDLAAPDGRTAPRGGPGQPTGREVRRAVSLILFTLVLPGTAQLLTGRRRYGRWVLRWWLSVLAGVVLLVGCWLLDRSAALRLLTSPSVLGLIAGLLMLGGVAWPALLVDAWLSANSGPLSRRARRWLAVLTAALVLLTGGTAFAAGQRVWSARGLITSVFAGQRTSRAVDGRYTVLLLGGDAGKDRVGLRPDSMTLASIDARSGRTSLFSLPRNLEDVQFPAGTAAAAALPNGWSCGDACLLNALYTWGSAHPQLFPGARDAGAAAMKQAIQGVTGLPVNYYVLIDLQGFRSLIDAMGGIELTTVGRVPIGGETSRISGYIEPGHRRLDGYHALWYARSRSGSSDYARMARQRCVMTAMLNQLDPATALRRFQGIAAASARVVSTDIPAGALSTFLDLAVRAKRQRITSVQFVPPLIVPARPDYTVIRARVRAALSASRRSGSPAAVAGTRVAAGDPGGEPSAAAPTAPVDVRSVCTAG